MSATHRRFKPNIRVKLEIFLLLFVSFICEVHLRPTKNPLALTQDTLNATGNINFLNTKVAQSPAKSDLQNQQNPTTQRSTVSRELAEKIKSIAEADKTFKIESKTGRALARMQGKRQADASGYSRRNEDPWFLDSPPYPLQPYRFVYNVKGKDGQTEQYRQEVGDGKFLTGSYGYVLPDGIYRHVDYVADDRGFRAYIRTSEPGTANQNPANVLINSNPVLLSPGVTYAPRGLDFPPANPYDYSTLRSSTELLRRPPGSIVGTPVRNFSSLVYGPSLAGQEYRFGLTPSPVTNQGSYGSSSLESSNNFNNSAHQYHSQPQDVQYHNRGSNSGKTTGTLPGEDGIVISRFKSLQPQQLKVEDGAWKGNYESSRDIIPPASYDYARLRPVRPIIDTSNEIFAPRPITPATLAPSPSPLYGHRFAPLGVRRSGPNVLAYDRVLSEQDQLGPKKLSYDYDYITHPDWNLLSLERARNITLLSQLTPSLSSPYVQPLTPRPSGFGHLAPFKQLNETGFGSSHFVGSSESHSSHESHHRSLSEDQGANFNGLSIRKEHHSGFKNGTGREFEFHKDFNVESPGPSSLLPPPPPVFSSHHNPQALNQIHTTSKPFQHSYVGEVTKGGPNQNATYNKYQHQEEESLTPRFQPLGVKGGSHRTGQRDLTSASPRSQMTSDELANRLDRTTNEPTEARQELEFATKGPKTTSSSDLFSTRSPLESMDKQTIYDSNRLTRQNQLGVSTKGGSSYQSVESSTRAPPPAPVTTIRMASEPKPGGMMSDLRSMQNSIGLPQPPRLHRSTLEPQFSEDRLNTGFGITEQIFNSRMNHVESLLRSNSHSSAQNNNQNQGSGLEASSVQRIVAVTSVPPTERDNNPRTGTGPKRSQNIQLSEIKKKINSGLLSKLGNFGQLDTNLSSDLNGANLVDTLVPSNETFEAQRLVKAARLHAEKVSELEKFQQRLKTQQLLLEHLKNPEKLSQGKQNKTSNKLNRPYELNLHVKYDEESDSQNDNLRPTTTTEQPVQQHGDYLRNRRQNDVNGSSKALHEKVHLTNEAQSTTSSPTTTTSTTTSTRRPPSEFAREVKSWPSLKEAKTKQILEANGLNDIDLGEQLNKTEFAQQKIKVIDLNTTSTVTSNSPSSRNNTINLDFINSVTALSVDQLNPFGTSSVNPSVALASQRETSRLSPHKLEAYVGSQRSPGVIATTSARYFNSPELISAIGFRDGGNHMKNLLPEQPDVDLTARDSRDHNFGSKWPSNHRFGGSSSSINELPPYMLASGTRVQVSAKSQSPTDSRLRHKTSSADGGSNHKVHSEDRLTRDGFEVRGTSAEVGQQSFFEVVTGANLRQQTESAQFQAFTDAQLSVSANAKRRRRNT